MPPLADIRAAGGTAAGQRVDAATALIGAIPDIDNVSEEDGKDVDSDVVEARRLAALEATDLAIIER